ncbi:uncharacterized protein LOC130449009 [Diorhabda sublineata]|uniref:uncharacterized protein LOC130449009 n=1 Tax=Diorhabda sublineata TaxID=1163346 RepID=UPI0024E17C3C|nr:uncharacterized protein LOC130449009 [Diorhabda sublineata]
MDATPSTSGLSSPPKRRKLISLAHLSLNKKQSLKSPSGKGKCLIILHAECEQGFVKDALLVFESKKTGDYHEDMNGTVFEQWFSEFLKKLPDGDVIVMDNASYHSSRIEKVSTTCSLKKDMQDWLRLKNIEFDIGMVRSELIYIINQYKENFNTYVTDEMAQQNNKVLLRLLPLLMEAFDNVNNINWQNCIAHVLKEEKMYKLDGIMDDLLEPIIISLSNDTDSDSATDTDGDNV